uniref:Methyltransferase FkbM family n=1 Tax=Rhodopseudomonas palustris (strain BisA53) TaxID=316055 RepID=Q07VJ1_RHOP5
MHGAVVHAGAYIGEEIEEYLAAGFDTIVLIEPNPQIFARLLVHVEFWRQWLAAFAKVYDLPRPPRIHAVNLAASDRAGIVPFFVTELAMYSSLLVPRPDAIHTASVIDVVTRPIDALMDDLGVDPSSVDLIVLDTQGSEHLVLAGASTVLPYVNAVVVETPKQLHQGQATQAALDALLIGHGLRRSCDGIKGASNAIYLREVA